MFCINCGIPLPEGANYCYKCGCKQEMKLAPPPQKNEFCYPDLVKYEYDEVEMEENYNSYNRSNERRAFIIVRRGGKVGAYDELFEHQYVPCVYDSLSIFTSLGPFFKVTQNNRVYLYDHDHMILDEGYDEIYVHNGSGEPRIIQFKKNGKMGFRLKKRVPSGSVGLCKYTYEVFNAVYDSLTTNREIVIVKQGNKLGMVGPWGTELPCLLDDIRFEIRPAKFEQGGRLFHKNPGYERRWLLLKYNGIVQEYPELLIREPNNIKYGFDLNNFGVFLLTD